MTFVIAVDGTAASGKGTISERLAKRYGFDYMDTGVLYRGTGVITKRDFGDPLEEAFAVKGAQRLANNFPHILDGIDLRTDEAGRNASVVGKHPQVRQVLFQMQRDFGLNATTGAILDGRDIGSVIFPEAQVKLFVDADIEIRTQRRYKDLKEREPDLSFDTLLEEMKIRDERDKNRESAPLIPMPDSIIIDSTSMGIDEVMAYVRERVDPIIDKFFPKKAL